MSIKRIGEFGLIDKISAMISTGAGVVKGLGDDCAVVNYSRDKYMLLTTDMLIEDIDFLGRDDPFFIGSKSIVASISDIAACGGWPAYALVTLGLPLDTRMEFVRKLYAGMNHWAGKYDINIVGGDISKADKIIINISLTGFVKKSDLALRSSARKGDIVFITGILGAASFDRRRLHITPRLEEARYLAGNYDLHAMIDLSDGLFQDLGHVLKSSAVGAVIYEDAVPLYKKNGSFMEEVSKGEDYELLFTMPLKEARRLNASGFINYTPIGNIVDRQNGMTLIDRECKQKAVKPAGFKHF